MITKNELLQGRDQAYPDDYSEEISNNLDRLLVAMNRIRSAYGKPMIVTSGWRPPSINGKTNGAASRSNHLRGLAVDIADSDGSLWKWLLANLDLLKELGVYLEDKRWTKGWTHLQIVPPVSGRRIYVPSTQPMTDPDAWDGKYDHEKYDKVA